MNNDYINRLMNMTESERKAHRRRERDLRRSLTYAIELSGEEVETIWFAAMLNRRMFDRFPEHEVLDKAFKLIEDKCGAIFHAEWAQVRDQPSGLLIDVLDDGEPPAALVSHPPCSHASKEVLDPCSCPRSCYCKTMGSEERGRCPRGREAEET